MSDASDNHLTPEGVARRDAMLGELVDEMSRAHRVRRVRRRVLVTAGCVGMLLLLGRLAAPIIAPHHDTTPQFVEHRSDHETPAAYKSIIQARPVLTVRVQTDPSIVERCRAAPTGTFVRIDDSTLIETLASIHRPAGLIRFGDRVALSAPVTDAELGIGH